MFQYLEAIKYVFSQARDFLRRNVFAALATVFVISFALALGLLLAAARADPPLGMTYPTPPAVEKHVCKMTADGAEEMTADAEIAAGLAMGMTMERTVVDKRALEFIVLSLGGTQEQAEASVTGLVWALPSPPNPPGLAMFESFDGHRCHVGGTVIPGVHLGHIFDRAGIGAPLQDQRT